MRRPGFYVAVTFVVGDDDAVLGDLALGYLEVSLDGAAGQRYRQCYEMQFIDKIVL